MTGARCRLGASGRTIPIWITAPSSLLGSSATSSGRGAKEPFAVVRDSP
jgi:hypothetical protein